VQFSRQKATRLTLFQAEQRLLNAQMQADYYRGLVAFLETVQKSGVESVIDRASVPVDLG